MATPKLHLLPAEKYWEMLATIKALEDLLRGVRKNRVAEDRHGQPVGVIHPKDMMAIVEEIAIANTMLRRLAGLAGKSNF